MHITILSGSHRQNSQSSKVAGFIVKLLQKQSIDTSLIDLAGNPIPMWQEDQKEEAFAKIWQPISDGLHQTDAFIIISPEWHGMVPAGAKNFLLLLKNELAHKAGLIVAVSAGMGGAYIVNELRTSGYKNSRINYIPDHMILRNVGSLLNGDEPASDIDASVRERLGYSLTMLQEYAKALAGVRASGKIDLKKYPSGL